MDRACAKSVFIASTPVRIAARVCGRARGGCRLGELTRQVAHRISRREDLSGANRERVVRNKAAHEHHPAVTRAARRPS